MSAGTRSRTRCQNDHDLAENQPGEACTSAEVSEDSPNSARLRLQSCRLPRFMMAARMRIGS